LTSVSFTQDIIESNDAIPLLTDCALLPSVGAQHEKGRVVREANIFMAGAAMTQAREKIAGL